MITVIVYQRSDGEYIGFETSGHADYADEGYDIICAAVSALTVNAVNSMETFTEDEFGGEQRDGYLKCMITGPVSTTAALLLKSMVLGLEMIQENYGKEYIHLIFKEV
ncbi:ribosomal-processing cysteine protease Prp [Lactonifactor longoviformis]|uniref:ribosomal-processing cysteine protease Prp n=1 Tax=Lactonifactor longoviformis TaxID=341220 RepID=UPI0036F3F5F2